MAILDLTEDDVGKMLTAGTHLGAANSNYQMVQYIYKRRRDGINILNLKKTWDKLVFAARAIVAVEDPAEVFVISSRPFGQRAVLKFAAHTGATPIAGRFTPGAFTNQIQSAFREPRLLVVTDPIEDKQPISEASYVNIPVISFCNTDSPLRYIDIAIPGNNKSSHSIGLLWWMLAREVLRLRGTIARDTKWDVVVDLFFYRDPEAAEKEEQAAKEAAAAAVASQSAPKPEQLDYGISASSDWNENADPSITSWAEQSAPTVATEAPVIVAASITTTTEWNENWNTSSTTGNWGGNTDGW